MTLPAQFWQEAADKARYLLRLLQATSGDARVRSLIVTVLADFERLSRRALSPLTMPFRVRPLGSADYAMASGTILRGRPR